MARVVIASANPKAAPRWMGAAGAISCNAPNARPPPSAPSSAGSPSGRPASSAPNGNPLLRSILANLCRSGPNVSLATVEGIFSQITCVLSLFHEIKLGVKSVCKGAPTPNLKRRSSGAVEHPAIVQHVTGLLAKFDSRLEQAKCNGILSFFNREERRLQAQAAGQPTLPYSAARSQLPRELVALVEQISRDLA